MKDLEVTIKGGEVSFRNTFPNNCNNVFNINSCQKVYAGPDDVIDVIDDIVTKYRPERTTQLTDVKLKLVLTDDIPIHTRFRLGNG